jgi:hypothetical protein
MSKPRVMTTTLIAYSNTGTAPRAFEKAAILSLFSIKNHAIKLYGSASIAPLDRGEWSASCLWELAISIHYIMCGCVGPEASLEFLEKTKINFPCLESKDNSSAIRPMI